MRSPFVYGAVLWFFTARHRRRAVNCLRCGSACSFYHCRYYVIYLPSARLPYRVARARSTTALARSAFCVCFFARLLGLNPAFARAAHLLPYGSFAVYDTRTLVPFPFIVVYGKALQYVTRRHTLHISKTFTLLLTGHTPPPHRAQKTKFSGSFSEHYYILRFLFTTSIFVFSPLLRWLVYLILSLDSNQFSRYTDNIIIILSLILPPIPISLFYYWFFFPFIFILFFVWVGSVGLVVLPPSFSSCCYILFGLFCLYCLPCYLPCGHACALCVPLPLVR